MFIVDDCRFVVRVWMCDCRAPQVPHVMCVLVFVMPAWQESYVTRNSDCHPEHPPDEQMGMSGTNDFLALVACARAGGCLDLVDCSSNIRWCAWAN
jgi:hypothetical protein